MSRRRKRVAWDSVAAVGIAVCAGLGVMCAVASEERPAKAGSPSTKAHPAEEKARPATLAPKPDAPASVPAPVPPVADKPAVTSAAAAEPAAADSKQSVSQYGITWTFSTPAEVGRYVTGDWWVVGPVTVASVDPAPRQDRNGSVVNPPAGGAQGYDRRMAGFKPELRASFPLAMKPGHSLVSTASVEKTGVKTPDTVKGQYCRGPLRTAVVLTCVKDVPAADAFRPAYVGTWKEQFRASQLRRDALPRLKPPAKVPGLAGYERYLERIWLDHQREWVNRKMHPLENMPDYGREITNIVSDVALLLLLDHPDGRDEPLLLRYVQKGIDYYGTAQSNGDLWVANGGHNSGRKWPILFAGLVLDHEGMRHVKASFQEDQQTYHGKGFGGKTVLWTITWKNPNARHEEVDPRTWNTFGDKKGNNGKKAEGYRRLNGPTWVGQALAARLTGMVDAWDHKAYFDYVDRWWSEEHKANGFVAGMWKMHRDRADEIGAEVQRKLVAGPPAAK